ncbi:MAG TPA: hypothetical protein VH280_07920 [Verrucomicrobiae bacterium]|jgi:hypothetical protein|nr:hypothetical protein [Verrucomicrobiae bacterium]
MYLRPIGLIIALAVMPAFAKAAPIPLPPQVPYLNIREDFFMGNGYAGAGGSGDGTWNFLVGPDYTCPNYLQREEIRLIVDGSVQALTMNVHRARKTGVFYGICTNGDLKVTLVDYALMGEPCVARMVHVENLSGRNKHIVSVRAYIEPVNGPGRSHEVSGFINNQVHWIQLKLDTSLKCVEGHFCTNWADRYTTIFFDKVVNTVTRTNDVYVFTTAPETIAAGKSSDSVLYHYMDYTNYGGVGWLEKHLPQHPSRDLTKWIKWWQSWFNDVAPQYSLDRIKDQRVRDLVEGGLATLKMNECREGGIVANERGWDMSYVRDGYCGLRGLTAFGHFEESKRFIQWLDRQYTAHGLIPNAGPGGSLTYAHPNGNNGHSCPEANAVAEVTALYILAARDYYNGTHDLQTLTNVNTSLSYSMDAQLKYAMTNNYRLEFSGDETELCGASDVAGLKDEGFNRKLEEYWSMTSVALCSASLDFYIQYLKAQGKDPAHYLNHLNKETLDLYDAQRHLQNALERDFWRTNVPNCPQGFHDWFRVKSNGAWPSGRLLNFTLYPVYYGTPLKYPDHARCDVEAMKRFFNPSIPLLPVTGIAGGKSLGHDLGYLLWGLVAVDDPEKDAVYNSLVNGPTAGCWGTYHEAYAPDGTPNRNGLRTFETGVDLSAIAKYWGIGGK